MKFSIATVYWGNNQNLESFIDDCLEYSDDIVIAYIDLFDNKFVSNKATVVELPFNFLLEHGYAAAYNIAHGYIKNNWVYNLGVGERITGINNDLLSKLSSTEFSAFIVRSEDLPGTWYRFGNIDKTAMSGRVHEELCSIELMGKVYKRNDRDVISSWKKVPYIHNNDFEKNVCEGYRVLSRAKWLARFHKPANQIGPSDYWWSEGKNFAALDIYNESKNVYKMNKKNMTNALSKRNDWGESCV